MRYEVHVTREDGWWMVHIPAIDGLTQARRLNNAETEAIDYIVVDQDVAPSSVEVVVTSVIVAGREFIDQISQAAGAREAAREANQVAAQRSSELAADLAAEAVPVRDIGSVLGVSYQRAQQLVHG